MISALLLDNELLLGMEKTLTRMRLDPCMLKMKSKMHNKNAKQNKNHQRNKKTIM